MKNIRLSNKYHVIANRGMAWPLVAVGSRIVAYCFILSFHVVHALDVVDAQWSKSHLTRFTRKVKN